MADKADIDITFPHRLGRAEAKRRAEGALKRLSSYAIRGTWQDCVFHVTSPAKGTFAVSDTDVRVVLTLGVLMVSIKDKIATGIRSELARALE